MGDAAAEYEELLARAAPFLCPIEAGRADAGYGLVAVAGDAWLRGRAEMHLRGLPELPLDIDVMVDVSACASDLQSAEEDDRHGGQVDGREANRRDQRASGAQRGNDDRRGGARGE